MTAETHLGPDAQVWRQRPPGSCFRDEKPMKARKVGHSGPLQDLDVRSEDWYSGSFRFAECGLEYSTAREFELVKLTLRDKETAQEAVRRFRKLVERSGIKKEIRIREFYEKPSETKRRARLRAARRSRRERLLGR